VFDANPTFGCFQLYSQYRISWFGNQCSGPGLMNQCRGFLGVGTYIEVWGVTQRRRCLRGMLSLHAEMLVSPNAANEAA